MVFTSFTIHYYLAEVRFRFLFCIVQSHAVNSFNTDRDRFVSTENKHQNSDDNADDKEEQTNSSARMLLRRIIRFSIEDSDLI